MQFYAYRDKPGLYPPSCSCSVLTLGAQLQGLALSKSALGSHQRIYSKRGLISSVQEGEGQPQLKRLTTASSAYQNKQAFSRDAQPSALNRMASVTWKGHFLTCCPVFSALTCTVKLPKHKTQDGAMCLGAGWNLSGRRVIPGRQKAQLSHHCTLYFLLCQ